MSRLTKASPANARVPSPQVYPRIVRRRLLRGCNAYHHDSILRIDVDLGPLTGLTTAELGRGFPQTFFAMFEPAEKPLQGWAVHPHFLERLAAPGGTPVEEALLEAVLATDTKLLARMCRVDQIRFAVVERNPDKTISLLWDVHDPEMSRGAAEGAVAGFAEIAGAEARSGSRFSERLTELLERAARRRLAGSTSLLKVAATRRGVPCEVLSGQHLVLGQGARMQQCHSSLTGTTSFSAAKLSLDKRQCNRRLRGLSLPVPQQIGVTDAVAAIAALRAIGAPVVIKPSNGNQGRGVSVGVQDPEAAREAFDRAMAERSGVLVEQQVMGTDYRLLVVGGRFVAATASLPAEVTGDGRRKIHELITELNREPDRDDLRLCPVQIDAYLAGHLASQGLTLDATPQEGQVVTLSAHGHVSCGGVPHDVTDRVHPDNRRIAEHAAAAIGLDVAGVDIVMPDVSQSYREVGGKILEVNTQPGLVMHSWPRSGTPRDVAGAIVDMIFPVPEDAFVPTLVIAGDRATGAAGQYAARLLAADGTKIGLALKNRAFLNGVTVDISKGRLGRAASILLRDPAVEVLVAALSLRRIQTHGLGLQTCDGVAVLREEDGDEETSRRGIEIAARANRGVFVIAATDQSARDALKHVPPDRIVMVCEEMGNPKIATHLAAGGQAVLRHWTPQGPRMRLERQGKVLAEAPLKGQAHTRQRNIEASMFAFGLVMAFRELQTNREAAMAVTGS